MTVCATTTSHCQERKVGQNVSDRGATVPLVDPTRGFSTTFFRSDADRSSSMASEKPVPGEGEGEGGMNDS